MYFYLLAAIFTVLWLAGVLTAHLFGGFIHILLVVAIVAFLYRILPPDEINTSRRNDIDRPKGA